MESNESDAVSFSKQKNLASEKAYAESVVVSCKQYYKINVSAPLNRVFKIIDLLFSCYILSKQCRRACVRYGCNNVSLMTILPSVMTGRNVRSGHLASWRGAGCQCEYKGTLLACTAAVGAVANRFGNMLGPPHHNRELSAHRQITDQ